MATETFKMLVKLAYEDYKEFERKYEVLAEQHPEKTYQDVIDLIEHEAPELPEELKDQEELYTAACLYVALNIPDNEKDIKDLYQGV